MSTRLVILGLLRERPLYGYEIRGLIEEHMGDWASINFGSIYFALGKLAEEGAIERIGVGREGNRPARSTYAITPVGRTEFESLLRGVWTEIERSRYPLDVGLFFLEALPRAEIVGYLRRRIRALGVAIEHVTAHRATEMANPNVPRLAEAIFDHSLAHLRAELGWSRELLGRLDMGDFD